MDTLSKTWQLLVGREPIRVEEDHASLDDAVFVYLDDGIRLRIAAEPSGGDAILTIEAEHYE